MEEEVHISNHKVSSRRGICGKIGRLSGYDPTKATCEKCINRFKHRYPEAWMEWIEYHEDGVQDGVQDDD